MRQLMAGLFINALPRDVGAQHVDAADGFIAVAQHEKVCVGAGFQGALTVGDPQQECRVKSGSFDALNDAHTSSLHITAMW